MKRRVKTVNIKSKFLNEDWSLGTAITKKLYHEVVEPLRKDKGIVDAHTHFSAEQIVTNEPFPDVFTAIVLDINKRWPNRDHYIIQLAAGEGIPFEFWYDESIPAKTKWREFARIFQKLTGTQVHIWTQLELNKTLGIEGLLSDKTAERVWEEANEKLKQEDYSPQGLLKKANVEVICTTDDPIDNLEYHIKAKQKYHIKAKQNINGIKILPTFRPDKAMNIFAEGWKNYVNALCGKRKEKPSFDGLLNALKKSHDFFAEYGCRASDHGIKVPYGFKVDEEDANLVFNSAYNGEEINKTQIKEFISFLMGKFCEMDKEKGWVTQIHFGAVRNINEQVYKLFGPDAGGDAGTRHIEIVNNLKWLLSEHCSSGDREKDAKVVLYSLNPIHYPEIAQLGRVFPGVSYGMAWWFNDSFEGMMSQLKEMYSVLPFSRCSGMVCDGRKLLSVQQRHDVFARAACNTIGGLVEKGLIPGEYAPAIIEGLCYNNQKKLFGF